MKVGKKLAFPILFFVALVFISPLFGRDWVKDPPWIEIPFAPRVAAIGDVHGAFSQMAASLEALGFAKRLSPDSFKLTWTGGKNVLVFVGDLNDRGENTKEVYDGVMDLEIQAKEAGGQVVSVLGNHEVLLLNGTVEEWAKTLKPPKKQHYQNTIDSFTKAGLDFHQAISKNGLYGSWIRRRPLFAIINGFLFVHGGLPDPARSRSDVAADFRDAVESESWSKGIMMDEKGPLWIREWWNNPSLIQQNFKTFGIRGVVFGHTVGALGHPGWIDKIEGNVVSIDIGMTPAYGKSNGGGILINADPNGKMVFRAKYPDRPEAILLQIPPTSSVKKT
ncbi:metallophosphoesterase, partial [bacterium]|nr:metallophosphoesterase [bacterium]